MLFTGLALVMAPLGACDTCKFWERCEATLVGTVTLDGVRQPNVGVDVPRANTAFTSSTGVYRARARMTDKEELVCARLSTPPHSRIADSGDCAAGVHGETVTIDFHIQSSAPRVQIAQPADGTVVDGGATVLSAKIEGTSGLGGLPSPYLLLRDEVQWTSSLDGPIANGASAIATNLSTGTHIIRVIASDPFGLQTTESVTVTVMPTGGPTEGVGTIEGTVRNGDPLAGVTMVLAGFSSSDTTTTNAQGFYRFTNLNPGVYTVSHNLPASTPLPREQTVELQFGETRVVNFGS